MSIAKDILESLFEKDYYCKGMRVNILGIPRFSSYSKRSLRSTADRLKKKGLIETENDYLKITLKGKKYLQRKQDGMTSFASPFKKDLPKNLLLIFDIPEQRKAEREWFRWHLKKFSYVMIQRSVWVGPSPLPKEFLAYLKEIKLENCIQTFKLSKSFSIKK